MPIDLRRFTHNEDVLWILNHLSRHGKVTKLKLGFCGRRAIRMSTRDGDFLNALKGVKTDKLDFGDPRPEVHSLHSVGLSQSGNPCQCRLLLVTESLAQLTLTSNYLNRLVTTPKSMH